VRDEELAVVGNGGQPQTPSGMVATDSLGRHCSRMRSSSRRDLAAVYSQVGHKARLACDGALTLVKAGQRQPMSRNQAAVEAIASFSAIRPSARTSSAAARYVGLFQFSLVSGRAACSNSRQPRRAASGSPGFIHHRSGEHVGAPEPSRCACSHRPPGTLAGLRILSDWRPTNAACAL